MVANKKKDLSAALAKAKEGQTSIMPPRVSIDFVSSSTTHNTENSIQTAQANQQQALSRKGKKTVITYLDPPIHVKLKVLAAQQGTTIQELSEKAYQLLFQQYEVS